MNTSDKALTTLKPELPVVEGEKPKSNKLPMCVSLTWNSLGRKLFAGFTDGNIRVWHVSNVSN